MAETYKDIALDSAGDLQIVNGDFVIAESDEQHIAHLIQSAKGEWKEFPLCGAELTKQLKGPLGGEFRREVRLQLEADGYKIEDLVISGSDINILGSR
ncbi:hypothetical protein SDC9_115656 [bioreactor metagenome]|uniref:Oxidase n=1 Tax=bioreactor metagenome TaxID=1076179 RepID=A0A645BU10_9ZZZZ